MCFGVYIQDPLFVSSPEGEVGLIVRHPKVLNTPAWCTKWYVTLALFGRFPIMLHALDAHHRDFARSSTSSIFEHILCRMPLQLSLYIISIFGKDIIFYRGYGILFLCLFRSTLFRGHCDCIIRKTCSQENIGFSMFIYCALLS